MKKLFILLLSVLSLTAFAQQKKVAVYVTGEQSGINKVLGDQLVAAFAQSGKYIAIERTTSFLAELGKEQNYQRTGAVSDNEISRLGRQFGVQYVCVADVSDVFGEKYVSARLIDVESVEIINAANASSTMNNMEELLQVTNSITQSLTDLTAYEKAMAEKKRLLEYAKKDSIYFEQLQKGYIQMGIYYVHIIANGVSWEKARQEAINCRIEGWNDWHLPTGTDVRILWSECADLSNITKYLPKSKHFIGAICSSLQECFWENQDYTYSCGHVGSKNGTNARKIIVLVRNVH